MKKWFLYGLIYVLCVFLSAGSYMANVQGSWKDAQLAREYYRSDLGFSIGYSLFPPAWFFAPFFTGFWEHGWGFKCRDGKP